MNRSVILLALALPVLVACGTVEPLPDDHYYRLLSSAVPEPRGTPGLAGVLLVELPSATGVRRNREILYSPPPHVRFQQYHYHHWEEAPPVMIRHRLVDVLRSAGVADAVTERSPAEPMAGPVWRLRTHLARFERLTGVGNPEALVELHVRLHAPGRPAVPVFERDYSARRAAADGSMDATVLAFAAALDEIMLTLAAELGP